ncbi:hemolysin-III related-domain-containing protein [Dendryphion nanum]|uniref:Hemolysin-III related-domain-containing protein n=1 Tax=Dendryphion nanum TaxID=256645 RepID=A0A9P9D312_9PLEO|nr:hemolysin-III related-domain-containing protein [Dendryphion nanum]
MLSNRLSRRFSRRRPQSSSYIEAMYSCLGLHSETSNIWSHAFGIVLFLSSAVQLASNPVSSTEKFAILMYLVAVIICLVCSTFYHIFSDHVRAAAWQRGDHLSIICVMWASSLSFSFFSFNEERQAYVAFLTITAILPAVRISTFSYSRSQDRWSRIITCIAFGCSTILPTAFDPNPDLLQSFWGLVMVNTLGGAVYATNTVDRAFWNNPTNEKLSHATMHVLFVLGTRIYYHGLLSVHNATVDR